VVPAREIGKRGVRRIALPDAAAVGSLGQLEGVLYATAVIPDVPADGFADDDIDLARVRRPDRKHQRWFLRAPGPDLVGAEPAALGEPVAFDLSGLAELEAALLYARIGVAHLDRDAGGAGLVLRVDDDAPMESPSALRSVEPHVRAPGRAAVRRREFLHGDGARLLGITALAVPTADQAHIAENRLFQAGKPLETHSQASHVPLCGSPHTL